MHEELIGNSILPVVFGCFTYCKVSTSATSKKYLVLKPFEIDLASTRNSMYLSSLRGKLNNTNSNIIQVDRRCTVAEICYKLACILA
jgi:hypothetical protein